MNSYLLIDSTQLFGVPTEIAIDISEIDVILVSNSGSILALPFFTENPSFNGIVYATEPVINIGKFFMEELVDFVQSVPKPNQNLKSYVKTSSSILLSSFDSNDVPMDDSENEHTIAHSGTGKETPNIFKLLPSSLNFPIKLTNQCFGKDLREIYTKKSISDALLKVKIVGFNENTVSGN